MVVGGIVGWCRVRLGWGGKGWVCGGVLMGWVVVLVFFFLVLFF